VLTSGELPAPLWIRQDSSPTSRPYPLSSKELFEPEEKCRLILQFLRFREVLRFLYASPPDKNRSRSVKLSSLVTEGFSQMIFYMQMRWNIEGRLTLDEVWDLEIEESKAAKDGFKILHMYKVAGQRRVIAVVETESAENLDRMIMGRLPMREVLEFEAIWPLRSFDGFLEDCKTHFGAKEISA
jgi:muconolactone D-isomerase